MGEKEEEANENIFQDGHGNTFNIETNLECSNKECKGNKLSKSNVKTRQRLYAAARQMEEDVSRHMIKDNPHGEQVKGLHYFNIFFNIKVIESVKSQDPTVLFFLFQLLELINVCSNTLHKRHCLVMTLKEKFVARPTNCE